MITVDSTEKELILLKNQILRLKSEGKKRTEIVLILNIDIKTYNKSLYFKTTKEKVELKLNDFKNRNGNYPKIDYTLDDVINKYSKNGKFECYLTGKQLDLDYISFDHIIPVSDGGSNEFDNLGIVHPLINLMKWASSVEDFIYICKMVVIKAGYKVIDP